MSDDKKNIITDKEFDRYIRSLCSFTNDQCPLTMADDDIENSDVYKNMPYVDPEVEFDLILKGIRKAELADEEKKRAPRENLEKGTIRNAEDNIFRMADFMAVREENRILRNMENAYEVSNVSEEQAIKVLEPRSPEIAEVGKAVGETPGLCLGNSNSSRAKARRITWKRIKMLGVVAAVFGVWYLAGITSIGNKSFMFRQSERENGIKGIVLDNAENISGIGAEEEAYALMEEQIGIEVLKIGDRPTGMTFSNVKINGSNASLYFEYKDKMLILREYMASVSTSAGAIIDGEKYSTVYNELLDRDFTIMKEEVTDGITKYFTLIEKDNTFYTLTGTIEQEEFERIVRDLHFN